MKDIHPLVMLCPRVELNEDFLRKFISEAGPIADVIQVEGPLDPGDWNPTGYKAYAVVSAKKLTKQAIEAFIQRQMPGRWRVFHEYGPPPPPPQRVPTLALIHNYSLSVENLCDFLRDHGAIVSVVPVEKLEKVEIDDPEATSYGRFRDHVIVANRRVERGELPTFLRMQDPEARWRIPKDIIVPKG